MKVTADDVKIVASLSRLKISDEESVAVIAQLDKFLTYVENLQSVDTSKIEPTTCRCKIFFVLTKLNRHSIANLRFQTHPCRMTDILKCRVFWRNRK